MAEKTHNRREHQLREVGDGKDDNRVPARELGAKVERDVKRTNKGEQAGAQLVSFVCNLERKLGKLEKLGNWDRDIPENEQPPGNGILEENQDEELVSALGEPRDNDTRNEAQVLSNQVVTELSDEKQRQNPKTLTQGTLFTFG